MQDGYAICFNEWALDKDIKDELGLLIIISSLSAEKGFCFASNSYLAKLFNINEVTVSRKLGILENKKYITIEYERCGARVTGRKIRLTKMLTDDYQKCKSTVNKNVKDNNTSINNTSINNNTYSVTEKQYEEFMEEYPKKTKTESVKRWFALNKPSETFFKILIDKVKEFKEYECKGKELRYIPDALTWLNEKRFKDEYKPKEIVEEVKTSKYLTSTPKNAGYSDVREYTEEFYESLYDD